MGRLADFVLCSHHFILVVAVIVVEAAQQSRESKAVSRQKPGRWVLGAGKHREECGGRSSATRGAAVLGADSWVPPE